MPLQRGGRETLERLRNWDRGQPDAERLAGQILRLDGRTPIPIHPKGGRDAGRDLIFSDNGRLWVVGCYFPTRPVTVGALKKKISGDLNSAKRHHPHGFVFVTNQEIKRALATLLRESAAVVIDLYDIERIRQILDDPRGYGVRLEFLEIEMTRDEQLSFFEAMQSRSNEMAASFFSDLRPRIQRASVAVIDGRGSLTINAVDPSVTVLHWNNPDVFVDLVNPTTIHVRHRGSHVQDQLVVQLQIVEHGPHR